MPQYLYVLAPALVSAAIVAAMVFTLWRMDRHAPLVDAGVIAAGASLIYIALPAVFFVLSGMTWSMTSDRRLFLLHITPQELGSFLWLPTSYLAAFCATYLVARKPDPAVRIEYPRIDWPLSIAIFSAIFLTVGWRMIIESHYGVSILRSNSEVALGSWTNGLPLIVVQLTQHMFGMENIAKMAGVIWLVSAARSNKAAWGVLALWLAIEAYSTVVLMGPRTYFAMLLIALVFAFHSIIRPLKFWWLAVLLPALLIAILGYGYMRDRTFDFNSANEFQILLGTPMQLRERLAEGGVEVPLGLYLHELLQFIPQQLLPIEKVDPSDWYVSASGIDARGGGFMFGVVSQSIVGLGWIELILRGVALAILLTMTHRIFVAKREGMLILIGYIWLCCTIYYSYRASTFYWLSFAVFRLAPLLLFIATVRWIASGLHRQWTKESSATQ